MPSAAETLYPNGPSTILGNQSAEQVLSSFQGNHEGALLWGEPQHREAYVAKYGYEKSLDVINSALKSNKDDPQARDWYDDMLSYRNDLLARQGS